MGWRKVVAFRPGQTPCTVRTGTDFRATRAQANLFIHPVVGQQARDVDHFTRALLRALLNKVPSCTTRD